MEGKGFFQNDVYQGIAAGQEVADFREQTGEEALWINSMFSGMPAYLINTRHYGEWLIQFVYDVVTLKLPAPAHLTFLSMLSFYMMLLVFGVRPYLAIVGGIAYGLSTFSLISIEAGHNWKVGAMATMPMVLGGVHATLHKNRYWGFVATIIALALQIKMNHLQITYYLLLMMLIYGGFQLAYMIKDRKIVMQIPAIALLLLAAGIAVSMSLGRLWTTSEYGQYSIRGKSELQMVRNELQGQSGLDKDYAFNWSLGKMESFTFMLPNFYGGASLEKLDESSNLYAAIMRNTNASRAQALEELDQVRTYWGDQPFTSGPAYMGIVVVFLFILGIIALPGRERNWLITATVFSILLAWGKNLEFFNYAMFDYFPGYNKFRAVSMAIVMAMLTMPLTGLLGLQRLLDGATEKSGKAIWLTAIKVSGGLMAFLLILWVGFLEFESPTDSRMIEAGYPDWYVDALKEDRSSMYISDWGRSLVFLLLIAGIVYLLIEEKIKYAMAVAGLAIIMSLDLIPIGLRYLHEENYTVNPARNFFQLTEANKAILDDGQDARALYLVNPWNDARISYHHQSIGGYHGAKLRRYQDLIEWQLEAEYMQIVDSLQNQASSLPYVPVMSMLNTRYLIAGNTANSVLFNRYAFGNAWLVDYVYAVESADEELLGLSEIELEYEALTTVFTSDKEYNAQGSITLTDRRPNRLVYEYEVDDLALAVFSEIYYPKGWKAFIGDEEVDIIRVNYLLRGLELPAGSGTITFKFEPDSFFVGNKVAGIANILVLALIAIGISLEIKKRR